ncbi:hypothetical protein OF117_03485 [Geodermatophilus sp. YIM 151500]|uniref:hypothetical protein n=1 Tax=Geodermatophilus sp. YIM 151500 TaxID=2984531 RepID=UPI0021E4BE4D|nr:hypothetical protein [Geodermatophilus sp. YIM 151500]MCV2488414.1 hypothetical protein [Geodermatophilus sp. YIM 151500]
MDLTARLARAAVARASVLVVEVPGWVSTRWAAAAELRRRGWRAATSPADADVLLVCGAPGPRLAQACDAVWSQLPGPRARADVVGSDAVGAALDRAAAALVDAGQQRREAHGRPLEPVMGPPAEPSDAGDGDRHQDGPNEGGSDHGDTDHGDTYHAGSDHAGSDHGDTDHGDGDMAPGGIPLAGSGGEDRDGLEMDVLSVPLGPVLPHWPAGLLLHCTLAGDVITGARAEVLGPADGVPTPGNPRGSAPDRLDRAATLLALAGADAAATTAARLRDATLVGDEVARLAGAVDRLHRRVHRSRLLRWAMDGAGHLDAAQLDLDPCRSGTVHDRLVGLLADACAALGGAPVTRTPTPVDALPTVLAGLEMGSARLMVASLDVDPAAELDPAGAA